MTDTPAAPQVSDNNEKIDVIINKRAGTVLRLTEEVVRKGLEESLGDRLGQITFYDPQNVLPETKKWLEGHQGEKRGLIVGGGDGTVLSASELFLNRTDVTLGVLPLGTHNLFARQLGFNADFREAAKQYSKVKASRVDVGNVNGQNFLVGLMIDQNSVDFYRARELHRDKKYFKAAGKFLSTVFGIAAGKLTRLVVSGAEHKGRVFFITNNQIAPKSNEGQLKQVAKGELKPVIENILFRGDADGKLGFYAFKGAAHNFALLLPKLWDGTWLEAKSVKVIAAPELVIQPSSKPNWVQKLFGFTPVPTPSAPVILDGEEKVQNFPLNVKILPLALPVYRPG